MRYHITPAGNVAECKARKGRCPFGSDEEHFNSKGEAATAYENRNSEQTVPESITPSDRMLRNSTHEAGYAARSYLRLLNHQDYGQAKALFGKVKDPSVIEAVKEIHRAGEALDSLQEQLTNSQNRVANARTDEQREGYRRNERTLAGRLTAVSKEYDDAKVAIDLLKKKYAGELEIHKRSLRKLERTAAADAPIDRPAGIEKRIQAVAEKMRNITRISQVSKMLGRGGDLDRVEQAASMYGKPEYHEAALKLRDSQAEYDALSDEQIKLQNELEVSTNVAVKRALSSNLNSVSIRMNKLIPTIRANAPKVALFKDEIRDRALYESDLERELGALRRIEEKTRN